MIPVVSFVGKSGSGKTAFLGKVVREFKQRGYRVAVVKHCSHDFDIDQPGKDTWQLAQAGSDVIVISSAEKMAFIETVDKELSLEQIVTLVGDTVDIVLTEGYRNANATKIEVSRSDRSQELLCNEEELLAIVSDHQFPVKVRRFYFDDAVGIVDLILTQMDGGMYH